MSLRGPLTMVPADSPAEGSPSATSLAPAPPSTQWWTRCQWPRSMQTHHWRKSVSLAVDFLLVMGLSVKVAKVGIIMKTSYTQTVRSQKQSNFSQESEIILHRFIGSFPSSTIIALLCSMELRILIKSRRYPQKIEGMS